MLVKRKGTGCTNELFGQLRLYLGGWFFFGSVSPLCNSTNPQNTLSHISPTSPRPDLHVLVVLDFCCLSRKQEAQWPLTVERSIAVQDAVENHGLYRVFVSRLLKNGF